MTTDTPHPLQRIEWIISEHYRIPVERLRGKERTREVAEARFSVWYCANRSLGYGYSYLGRIYEKHHTSIMHGIEEAERTGKGHQAMALVSTNNPHPNNNEF